MKKVSLVLASLIALTIQLFAQNSDVSKARWNSKGIVIDGNDNDWIKPLNFFDSSTGLMYAISNDREGLYLIFTCNEGMKMRKIMSAGWTIELSSKEKKKKFKSAITIPGVQMPWLSERRPLNNLTKKIDINPSVTDYKSGLSVIGAKGFQSGKSELKLNDRFGISIAIGADTLQHIIYEIAIPLNELFVENSIRFNELITLNIKVNAMERPSFSGGGGDGGGRSEMGGGRSGGGMSMSGMGGGMGGMGGGRSGMGGMGGGRSGIGGGMSRGSGYGERTSSFDQASFKQKFVLTGN